MTTPTHPDGSVPEFSRMIDVRHLPAGSLTFAADAAERRALAVRFGLVAIEGLSARIMLEDDGGVVVANGELDARVIQPCAISGEDLAVAIAEPLALRFVAGEATAPRRADEEIELDADELDEIAYTGTSFDLGEAIAQSLALAIDPYATGPDADRVRHEYGLDAPDPAGPFAALAALKRPPTGNER